VQESESGTLQHSKIMDELPLSEEERSSADITAKTGFDPKRPSGAFIGLAYRP
jgi:hypothetical protein